MITFGSLPVGAKFYVKNLASGQVLPSCPVHEKITPFQWYTGRRFMNVEYEARGRKNYEYFQEKDEVVPV